MILQDLDAQIVCFDAGLEHDKRGDNLPPLGVVCANDCAFRDFRVCQQRRLDLGSGDVVARRDDHIVVTDSKMKSSVPIPQK